MPDIIPLTADWLDCFVRAELGGFYRKGRLRWALRSPSLRIRAYSPEIKQLVLAIHPGIVPQPRPSYWVAAARN